MSFIVSIPNYLTEVSRYTVNVIFNSFWNMDVEIEIHEGKDYRIKCIGKEHELTLPSHFVNSEKESWLKKREISDWGFKSKLSSKERNTFTFFYHEMDEEVYRVNTDYIGSVFFLLNRYHEQVVDHEIDQHGRIKSENTFLVRKNLIRRPLVDELLEEFSMLLKNEFGVSGKSLPRFTVSPSHDVDRPFEYLYLSGFKMFKRNLRNLIGGVGLSKVKDENKAFKKVRKGDLTCDPNNTFDWLMKASEDRGLTSTFHFIAEKTDDKYDQSYDIINPEIKHLLKEINQRGHLIALHPSYNSTLIEGQISSEFKKLKKVAEQELVKQKIWKSRNHYLRWNEDCLIEFEKAKIDIDQTLTFADQPGFRCGTSKAFHPYNFKINKASQLVFEPLVVMEASLLGINYLNLSQDLPTAWNIVQELKSSCREYGSNFSVLWHNNNLKTEEMKEFYIACIS